MEQRPTSIFGLTRQVLRQRFSGRGGRWGLAIAGVVLALATLGVAQYALCGSGCPVSEGCPYSSSAR